MGHPIAILSEESKALFLNRPARRLLGLERAVVLRRGALCVSTARGAVEILQLATHRQGGGRARPVVAVDGLLITLHKLPAMNADSSAPARARWLAQLHARPSSSRGVVATLEATFGLSAAESRLVARIYSGEPLKAAARSLGRSYNTTKSQLRSVFTKLGVRSQAQLLLLLSQSALLQDE
ncbi:MAG: LuxR C-terminal-related transcriptional regulator [Steroidobacteraceae bacterium]|jgi:DNA-binding CsgD family transcriptional regulator|nr:LuxR C-terminal-related transcriptional regulator [Steroidobacteraceae bacterium]